jgi:dTDP-4-amino-4,6-dideoxygalactose transaminase
MRQRWQGQQNGDVHGAPTVESRQTRATSSVRFVDLEAQHSSLTSEIIDAWSEILGSADFIGGKAVEHFETALADYIGARNVVGVANGTDALSLALLAAGVEVGDEVVTVAHTFVATVEAIVAIGAIPVLVDVEEDTGTIDVLAMERAITPRTRAVVPVHLYGQTASMWPLLDLASSYGLAVIEDACQAIGARYQGERAGSMGTASAFSFYPGKNLGACGDAGAVATNNDALADRLRQLRNHGQADKSVHLVSGFNSRLDSLQAAALGVKLPHLDEWTESRRIVADEYQRGLDATIVDLPSEVEGNYHAYHLYVIRHGDRDRLRSQLADMGIPTGTHYPTPVHLQPAFFSLGDGLGSFPVSEDWARRCVSLPMHAHMSSGQVHEVIAAVNEVGSA